MNLASNIERLESRITPATFTWTGAGADSLWSTGTNWDQGVAPSNADDLVFPASASRLTNTNDLTNLAIVSLSILDLGYQLDGNPVAISSGITTAYASGSSAIEFDVLIDSAELPVDVAAGGTLYHSATLGQNVGTANLKKTGGGIFELAGSTANTFSGATIVDGGTLVFAKPDSTLAITGGLTISDGATVQLLGSDQIPGSSSVVIGVSATLDLNNYDQSITDLTIKSGTVSTGVGTLSLSGDIFAQWDTLTTTASLISGHLDVGGGSPLISVDDNPSADYELNITAEISGTGGFQKTGLGILTLGGANSYAGLTTVSSGAVRAESSAAFGTTDSSTLVDNGASIYFAGTNLFVTEGFEIQGTGLSTTGVINLLYGSAELTGVLFMPNGDSEIVADGLLTISGVIDDDGESYGPNYAAGTNGLITIKGNNVYTQSTLLRSGIIRVENDNAFGLGSFSSTVSVLSGATLQLSAGITLPTTKTLDISGLPVSNQSKIMNLAGDNTIQGDISITGGNNVGFDAAGGTTLTISGAISGSRDFDKNGTGTLVLSGTSTHTGNVNVGDGTMLVNGSLATSNQVFSDGLLGGTGTLPAVIISSIGTLSPGTSPGTMQTGSLSLDSGSTYSIQLNGATAGTSYDQTIVVGSVVLTNPTLSVSLGYSPAAHTDFKIIDNDGNDAVTGTFNGLAEGATFTVGSQQFTISYVGGDGNDVTLRADVRTSTWSGAGGDNNWSTAANWVGSAAPLAGNRIVFPASASNKTSNNDFSAGTVFNSIVLEDTGYSFTGNSVQLDEGVTTTYSSGSQTLPYAISLTANQTIEVAAGGTLTLSGAISGAHSLTKTGNGVLQFSALSSYSGGTTVSAGTVNLITSSTLLGSGAVTVSSGATLGFNGSASLPNALSVGGTGFGGNGAIRTYGNSSSDVITGNISLTADLYVFVASQSQIAFNGAISGSYGISAAGGGTISLAGNTSNTFTGSYTQANTFTVAAKSGGAIAIPGDLILTSGTFLTQRDEQISDTAILYVNTGAEFDLLNSNETIGGIDFTGGTVTSNSTVLTLKNGGTIRTHASSSTAQLLGTIDLNGAQCVITNDSGTTVSGIDLTIAATLQNGSIRKAGSGNLSLAPSVSNTYAGGTEIVGGTVTISKNTSFGTGSVSIQDSTVVISASITVANNFTVDSTVLAFNNTTGSSTLSGTIDFVKDLMISTSTGTTLTLSGAMSDGGNQVDVIKSGSGTLVLSGSNSYEDTSVNAGTLEVGSSDATGTVGAVTLASGTTIKQTAATYAIPSLGLSIAGSTSYVVSGSSAYTVSGNIYLTGEASFFVSNSSASLEVSGVISGAYGFAKGNAGRLILTGANTFSGNVVIGAGSISARSAAALGTNAGNTTIYDGATLDFDTSVPTTISESVTVGSSGGSATITQSSGTNTLSGAITLVSNAVFDVTAGGLLVSGSINDGAGTFGIDKSGSSALTLSGLNTYDGATNILAGSLIAASGTALGSTTGGTAISDGATLKLDIAAGATISEPLTVGSAGGTASIENVLGNNILSGAVSLTSTGAITVTAGSLELSGVISDGSGILGLSKSGTGNLILSAANTFDGSVLLFGGGTILRNASGLGSNVSGTLISSSTSLSLDLPGSSSLNEPFALSGNNAQLTNSAGSNTLSGPIVVTAAGYFGVDGGQLTLTGPVSGSGGVNKVGTGTLVMSGSGSYVSNTVVQAGSLLATRGDSLSTTLVQVDDGATLALQGSITLGASALVLRGAGYSSAGALQSISGDNVFSGQVYYSYDTDINVNAGTLLLSGAITASGQLAKAGGGKLILSGSNSLSGQTSIWGPLEVRSSNALAGSSIVDIFATGQLLIKDATVAQPISIDAVTSGVAALQGLGTLSTVSGTVSLNANFNIGAEAGNTLVISGQVDDDGTPRTITKMGDGIVQFTNATNVISPGSTLITQAGQVLVTNASALGSANLQAQSGGEFVLMGGVTVPNAIQISGGGPNGVGAIRSAGGNNVFSGNVVMTDDASIGVTAGSLRMTGVISNTGTPYALTKNGAGSLVLEGNNSYDGPTTVAAGTLYVNGFAGNSQMTVLNGATLGGNGTTGPVSVNLGGTYAPGNSPDVLTVSSLVLTSGSTYVQEINGASPGNGTTGFDQTVVTTGSVILAGATLSASIGGGYTPTPGDVLMIIDNQSNNAIVGGFNGYSQGSLLVIGNYSFRMSYVGGDGNDLTLTYVAPTTTVVTSSLNPSTFGQSITFTATVNSVPAGFTPGGNVSFFDGSILMAVASLDGAGQATFSTNGFSAGFHGITAVYSGANTYFGSGSAIYLQGVNKAASSLSLFTSNPASVFGESVSFTATVTPVAPGAGAPSGNVTFRNGSTVLGVIELADVSGVQTAVFTTSALATGLSTITADYAGDLSFNASTSNTQQTVLKADTSVVVASAGNTVFGQAATFTATVSSVAPGAGTPTGTVTFYDGVTTLGTGTLTNGVATFTTSQLSVASHSITATYTSGDSNFNASSASSPISQVVSRASTTTGLAASTNPSAFGQSVTYTATVTTTAPGAGVASGTVSFFDGATLMGAATLTNGVATLTTSNLSVTTHALTAVYTGDGSFNGSTSSSYSQVVTKASTSAIVSSSLSPSVFGQSVTLTATVSTLAPGSGVPTGTVSFMDGTSLLGTATLDGSGIASLSTSGFSAGIHGITVVYAESGSFFGSTSALYLQGVNRANSSLSLSSDDAVTFFGQSVSFTAVVTAGAPGAGTPSGNVTFRNGSTILGVIALANVSGQQTAVYTTSALAPGSYTITAEYAGDASFNATSGTTGQTVFKSDTSVIVVSSGNTVFGQSVTFTATVSATNGAGTPTGTVTFYDGATTLGTGTLTNRVATLTTSQLSVASHSITATYTSGDDNFNASLASSPISQVVSKASTSTGLATSLTPSAYGQSVTLTATVATTAPGAGVASGTVTFYEGLTTVIGTATLSNGVATLSTSAFLVGNHPLTAVYEGGASFESSTSSNLWQVVNRAPTTGSVTSSLSPSAFGQSVTFTATIASQISGATIPGGSVTFMDGTTTLGTSLLDGSGVATLTTNGLASGAHSITAVYNGNPYFLSSTTGQYQQVVNKSDASVTVIGSGNTVFGQLASFEIIVSATLPGAGVPTGFVTLREGNLVLSVVPVVADGGVARGYFSTTALSADSHTISALYQGNGSFNTATGSTIQTVEAAETSTSLSGNVGTVYGQAVNLTASVSVVSPGAGTPSGTVVFVLNNLQILGTATLDQNGNASISTSAIPVGSHTLQALFSSDSDNFAGSSSSVVGQQVSKASTSTAVGSSVNPSAFGQSVVLTATVSATAPGSGIPTGFVTFYDGATSIGTATLSNGVATLTTAALARGSHSITAAYTSGDEQFLASAPSFAYSQGVNPASTTTSLGTLLTPTIFGQSATFTATVTANLPGAGTPTGIVTFYDDLTQIGTAVLDAGVATFSTSALAVGNHGIRAMYRFGDDSFLPSLASSVVYQNVLKADTSTSLGASINPTVFGQAVTFTATVTATAPGAGIPTGMVTFYSGATALAGAMLSNGVATFTTSSLPVGSSSISATYTTSDASFNAGSVSSPISMLVNPAQTTTVVVSSTNPQLLGGSVTFTATTSMNEPGAGMPNGVVQFFDGATLIGSAALSAGSASITTASLSTGDHSITATFIPSDSNSVTSTSVPMTETIVVATSSVSLLTSLNPSFYSQSVMYTAVVTTNLPMAGTPTGVVSFLDGDTVIATASLSNAGTASVAIDNLGAGTHAIRALYSGTGSITPGGSATTNQVVVPAPTWTTIQTQRVRIGRSQTQYVVATVSNLTGGTIAPTGVISLFSRGKLLTTFNVANGVGRTPYPRLKTNIKNITAVFQSTNFATSTSVHPRPVRFTRSR